MHFEGLLYSHWSIIGFVLMFVLLLFFGSVFKLAMGFVLIYC